MDVVYDLDAQNRLVMVNEGWDLFADSNGAPELFGDEVVGMNLWQLIDNSDVASLYALVFSYVRQTGQEVEFPYRCDSPFLKRFMLMRISRVDEGRLRVHNRIVDEQAISPNLVFVERQVPAQKVLNRCSVCNSLSGAGCREWVDIDKIDQLATWNDEHISVAHTVCRHCRDRISALLP